MRKLAIGILVAGCASSAFAGTDDDLQRLGNSAAQGYLKPIVSTLGADMNQGWFREAPKPELWGIDVSAKVVVVGAFFNKDAETFSTSTTSSIDPQTAELIASQVATQIGLTAATGTTHADTMQNAARAAAIAQVKGQIVGKEFAMSISGPTIIGSDKDEITYNISGGSVVVPREGKPDTTIALQGQSAKLGFGGAGLSGFVPGVPALFPQITIGTVAGTQVAIRYAPSVGDFSFFGIGINHNPGFWTESAQLPLGINSSVAIAYSSLKYGDFMEFSAWNASLLASRRFGWRFLHLTPYVGLGVEGSSLKVSYETSFIGVDGKPLQVEFESEGENLFHATLGSKIRLGVIDLSADYTFAKYSAMSVAFGLGF